MRLTLILIVSCVFSNAIFAPNRHLRYLKSQLAAEAAQAEAEAQQAKQEALKAAMKPKPTKEDMIASQKSLRESKLKHDVKPNFDQAIKLQTSYHANGGIGIRSSQHFFPNPLDMDFVDGVDHLDECHDRRLANLIDLYDHSKVDESGIHERFGINYNNAHTSETFTQGDWYVSYTHWRQKWDSMDNGSQGICSAQNGSTINTPEAQDCEAPTIEELDLTKENLRSNRIKMGLTAQIQDTRQSSLMSLAFGWLPSVELPVEKIEKNENEQIVESMLAKMAKKHNIENYRRFTKVFGQQDFTNKFYTVNHASNHPISKMGGILKDVLPKQKDQIEPTDQTAFELFNFNFGAYPDTIVFNKMNILMPQQQKFWIQNNDKVNSILIADILTSSPEIIIYLPPDMSYPMMLGPSHSVQITVVVIPETLALLQGAIHIIIESNFVFMMPVTAFVQSNPYEIEPIYYTDVNVGEQVLGMIKLKSDSDFEILETYSTEDFVKLYWPNNIQVASPQENKSSKDFSKYMKIEACTKLKSVFKFIFYTDQAVDHRAIIHILTSKGDVLRIPIYFHIYTDLVKFTPSIVDFGTVAYQFDLLRVNVNVNLRNGFEIGNTIYLTEVLLPLSEKRLDFYMGKWDRETTGNIQVYNQLTGKLEEQRRAVIQIGKQVDIITVIMNPSHYGLIDTTLILVFKLEDGSEHILELPIIGNVLRQNTVLAEYQGARPQKFEPWHIASPAITLNVAPFLTDAGQSSQLIKSKFVEERLIVENTFNTTLKGFEVVLPENAIFTFTYQSGSSSKQVGTSKNAALNSGQSLQLGSIMMNLKDIKTTMGRMYFFLHTNQNMFVPMAVQISDQKLICSYEQDAYMPVLFVDCASGVTIDFHDVLNNHDYHKTMNISNIGSDVIFFDSAMFDSQYLSLRVKAVDPPSPFTDRGPTSFKMGPTYNGDQSSLHAWLLPKQTVTLEFTFNVSQKQPENERDRRIREVRAKFNFQPASYEAFTVAFTYKQFNGDIKVSFSPARMNFEKTYLGKTALEAMMVSVNTNLPESRPVILRSVSCADLKFKINVLKTRLSKNGEEFIQVMFDPNSILAQSSYSVVVKDAKNNVVQRIQNQDISKIDIPHNFTPNKVIRELEAQDFRQFRNYKDNSPFAAMTIKTQLIIETDLLTKAVDLVGEIVTPKIMEMSSIDFGQVQLGSFAYSPTTVISNPFNEQIIVQIYIGLDIFEEEQKRIADIARQKDQNNEEKFLNRYPHTRSYCRRHLKGPGPAQPSATPPPPVQSTIEEVKNNWMDEWNIRVMSMNTEPTSMCKSVLNVLMNPDYNPENHKQLWEQVEYFFFEKILVDNVQIPNQKFAEAKPTYTTEDYRKADMQQSLDLIAWSFTQSEYAAEKEISEDVDSEVVADALQCSAKKQFLNRRNTQNMELTRQISFPNPLDFWFPAKVTLKNWFNFVLTPFSWSKNQLKIDQTWLEWASLVASQATQSMFDAVQHSTFQKQSRSATRGARPEDFLVKRNKDPNLKPAMAVTNQYQLNNPGLHNSLLQYNGTVPNSVQSFYLNERYSQPMVIPAKSNITLTNLLIFEPPTLQTKPFAMNLYVKCDHLTMTKVKITGEAVTGLLELSDVWKVTRLQNGTQSTAMTHLGEYSYNERMCQFYRFSDSWQNMKTCLGEEKEQGYVEFVQQQVLGQSVIQHLIKVDIELADVLMGIPNEQTFNQMFLQTCWNTIKQTLWEKSDQTQQTVMIADYMYGWFTFVNVGTSPIQLIKYGFEDPITGEISCESDGIFIQNCPQLTVETIKGNFEVVYKLKFDFTTTLLKRTLIFETMTHVQRFPVHFKIDEKALQLANQYNYLLANNYSITELVVEVLFFTFIVAACMLKLMFIVINLIYQKQPTAKQLQPEPQQELSLQSSALVLYLQTQDRFKLHNAQFMRESTNVIKKSNSAFAEYQKNLGRLSQLVRKPAQVVTRLRIKPSLATQIEDDVLSNNTPSNHSQHESKDNYCNIVVTSENEEKSIDKLPQPVQLMQQMPVKMLIEKSLKSEEITAQLSRKERKALELKKKEKVDHSLEMVMVKQDYEESKKVEVAPVQQEIISTRKQSIRSPQPQDFVTENEHLTPQKQLSQKLKDKIMASNIDSLLEEKVFEVKKQQELAVEVPDDIGSKKMEVVEANQQHISTESEEEHGDLVQEQPVRGKDELEPESRSESGDEEEEEEEVPEPVRQQTITRKVHQQYVAKESHGYLASKNGVQKVVPTTTEYVVSPKVHLPKIHKPTFSRYDPSLASKYVTTSSSEKAVQPTRYQEHAAGPIASRRQIIDTRATEHQRSTIASDYAEQQWAKKPSPMIASNQQEQEYWRQKQLHQQVQTPPFQQQFVRSSTAATRGRGGQEYVTSRQPQQLASQSYERKQVSSNKFQSDRVGSQQQSLQSFRQPQPYSHYQDYGDYDPETINSQHQSHQAYQLQQSREPQPPQVAPYQKRIPPHSIGGYQHGRHSQAQIIEDAYDPENIYDYDQEYGEEEGYSASQLTANQPPLRESREQQYQHYQKRPYWQNEQPVVTPAHAKPTLKSIQTKQEIFQPKAVAQPTFVAPKPVTKFQPINETPSNQTTYWKPKEKQKKPPSPDQRTVQTEQQQVKNDQEQEPVRQNNFYNAFKSIQTIFSQNKQADEDHSPSDARSKSRERRSGFSSIFSSGNSLFANSKPLVPDEDQPRFSLFGDSVFDKTPSNPDWSSNAQTQHFQQPAYRQQQQQQPSMFGDLQFKQLKPYNNAFADSLDVLTSKQVKGTQLPVQRRPQFRFTEEDEEDEEEEQKTSAGYRLF